MSSSGITNVQFTLINQDSGYGRHVIDYKTHCFNLFTIFEPFPVTILSSGHKKNEVETCLTLFSFNLPLKQQSVKYQWPVFVMCVAQTTNNKARFELWLFFWNWSKSLIFIKTQFAFESLFWENSSITFWVISRFEYWSRSESELIKFIPGVILKIWTRFPPNLRKTFWDKLETCKQKT